LINGTYFKNEKKIITNWRNGGVARRGGSMREDGSTCGRQIELNTTEIIIDGKVSMREYLGLNFTIS